jgi:hypothetical protein
MTEEMVTVFFRGNEPKAIMDGLCEHYAYSSKVMGDDPSYMAMLRKVISKASGQQLSATVQYMTTYRDEKRRIDATLLATMSYTKPMNEAEVAALFSDDSPRTEQTRHYFYSVKTMQGNPAYTAMLKKYGPSLEQQAAHAAQACRAAMDTMKTP